MSGPKEIHVVSLSLSLSLLSRSKANRVHPEQLPTEDVNFKRKKKHPTRERQRSLRSYYLVQIARVNWTSLRSQ